MTPEKMSIVCAVLLVQHSAVAMPEPDNDHSGRQSPGPGALVVQAPEQSLFIRRDGSMKKKKRKQKKQEVAPTPVANLTIDTKLQPVKLDVGKQKASTPLVESLSESDSSNAGSSTTPDGNITSVNEGQIATPVNADTQASLSDEKLSKVPPTPAWQLVSDVANIFLAGEKRMEEDSPEPHSERGETQDLHSARETKIKEFENSLSQYENVFLKSMTQKASSAPKLPVKPTLKEPQQVEAPAQRVEKPKAVDKPIQVTAPKKLARDEEEKKYDEDMKAYFEKQKNYEKSLADKQNYEKYLEQKKSYDQEKQKYETDLEAYENYMSVKEQTKEEADKYGQKLLNLEKQLDWVAPVCDETVKFLEEKMKKSMSEKMLEMMEDNVESILKEQQVLKDDSSSETDNDMKAKDPTSSSSGEADNAQKGKVDKPLQKRNSKVTINLTENATSSSNNDIAAKNIIKSLESAKQELQEEDKRLTKQMQAQVKAQYRKQQAAKWSARLSWKTLYKHHLVIPDKVTVFEGGIISADGDGGVISTDGQDGESKLSKKSNQICYNLETSQKMLKAEEEGEENTEQNKLVTVRVDAQTPVLVGVEIENWNEEKKENKVVPEEQFYSREKGFSREKGETKGETVELVKVDDRTLVDFFRHQLWAQKTDLEHKCWAAQSSKKMKAHKNWHGHSPHSHSPHNKSPKTPQSQRSETPETPAQKQKREKKLKEEFEKVVRMRRFGSLVDPDATLMRKAAEKHKNASHKSNDKSNDDNENGTFLTQDEQKKLLPVDEASLEELKRVEKEVEEWIKCYDNSAEGKAKAVAERKKAQKEHEKLGVFAHLRRMHTLEDEDDFTNNLRESRGSISESSRRGSISESSRRASFSQKASARVEESHVEESSSFTSLHARLQEVHELKNEVQNNLREFKDLVKRQKSQNLEDQEASLEEWAQKHQAKNEEKRRQLEEKREDLVRAKRYQMIRKKIGEAMKQIAEVIKKNDDLLKTDLNFEETQQQRDLRSTNLQLEKMFLRWDGYKGGRDNASVFARAHKREVAVWKMSQNEITFLTSHTLEGVSVGSPFREYSVWRFHNPYPNPGSDGNVNVNAPKVRKFNLAGRNLVATVKTYASFRTFIEGEYFSRREKNLNKRNNISNGILNPIHKKPIHKKFPMLTQPELESKIQGLRNQLLGLVSQFPSHQREETRKENQKETAWKYHRVSLSESKNSESKSIIESWNHAVCDVADIFYRETSRSLSFSKASKLLGMELRKKEAGFWDESQQGKLYFQKQLANEKGLKELEKFKKEVENRKRKVGNSILQMERKLEEILGNQKTELESQKTELESQKTEGQKLEQEEFHDLQKWQLELEKEHQSLNLILTETETQLEAQTNWKQEYGYHTRAVMPKDVTSTHVTHEYVSLLFKHYLKYLRKYENAFNWVRVTSGDNHISSTLNGDNHHNMQSVLLEIQERMRLLTTPSNNDISNSNIAAATTFANMIQHFVSGSATEVALWTEPEGYFSFFRRVLGNGVKSMLNSGESMHSSSLSDNRPSSSLSDNRHSLSEYKGDTFSGRERAVTNLSSSSSESDAEEKTSPIFLANEPANTGDPNQNPMNRDSSSYKFPADSGITAVSNTTAVSNITPASNNTVAFITRRSGAPSGDYAVWIFSLVNNSSNQCESLEIKAQHKTYKTFRQLVEDGPLTM